MSYKIEEIEGISTVFGGKLRSVGITTVAGLLEKCASKAGRAAVAKETEINEKFILKWTNHADLFRINGVGRNSPNYWKLPVWIPLKNCAIVFPKTYMQN